MEVCYNYQDTYRCSRGSVWYNVLASEDYHNIPFIVFRDKSHLLLHLLLNQKLSYFYTELLQVGVTENPVWNNMLKSND